MRLNNVTCWETCYSQASFGLLATLRSSTRGSSVVQFVVSWWILLCTIVNSSQSWEIFVFLLLAYAVANSPSKLWIQSFRLVACKQCSRRDIRRLLTKSIQLRARPNQYILAFGHTYEKSCSFFYPTNVVWTSLAIKCCEHSMTKLLKMTVLNILALAWVMLFHRGAPTEGICCVI